MRRWTAPIIVVWLLLCAPPLGAQTGAESAVTAGHAALARFQRGDFAGALAQFRRAEALAHSPVFALYVARCERNLGHLLEARAWYRRVSSEVLGSGAPAPWRRAQKDALVELDEVAAWIPSVVIDAADGVTHWELDGKPRTKDELGVELELDPGTHRVVVTGPAGSSARTIELAEGVRAVRVKLELPPAPTANGASPSPSKPPSKPPSSPAPRAAQRPPPTGGRSFARAPVLVPLAVGALGLVTGAIFGGKALAQTNRIKSRCNGNDCDPADAAKAEQARRWADIATVSFTVAAAGLAVGLGIHAVTGRSREPRVSLNIGGAL